MTLVGGQNVPVNGLSIGAFGAFPVPSDPATLSEFDRCNGNGMTGQGKVGIMGGGI